MITFLTSSPTGDFDGKYRVEGIDNRNGFLDALRKVWRDQSRCLICSASPDDWERNEEFAEFLWEAFARSDLSCQCVDILDSRWKDISGEEVCSYDILVLGGGHVPTQNIFFHEICLREKIEGFSGIVMGISAGSMNAADIVYSQPEEEGEAIDPSYERFLEGLGLTQINVLPHYQVFKDAYLDGMKLYDEITCPDSVGREFIAIPDGSYIVIEDGKTRIYGDAWRVNENGLTFQKNVC